MKALFPDRDCPLTIIEPFGIFSDVTRVSIATHCTRARGRRGFIRTRAWRRRSRDGRIAFEAGVELERAAFAEHDEHKRPIGEWRGELDVGLQRHHLLGGTAVAARTSRS